MAICEKSHYYDERQHGQGCPHCAQMSQGPAQGGAPNTVFEGSSNGPQPHSPPAGHGAPTTRLQDGRPGPGWSPRPLAPPPGGGGPRTMMDEAVVAERLMGFLVVVSSREDEEYRYVRLKKGVNTIGRFGSRAVIEVRDHEASEEHALVLCTNNCTRVIDLDSSNGLFVDGQRTELAELTAGDVIKVGRTSLAFVPFGFIADD